ncbi:MAG TPA: HU family DNA-binding protein, partial [Myxococcales bacterium]
KGDNIEIRGLGAFHVKNYQGYNGRNPKTGEVIPVKPKRGILFRTGKELRDRVNRSAGQPREKQPLPKSETGTA